MRVYILYIYIYISVGVCLCVCVALCLSVCIYCIYIYIGETCSQISSRRKQKQNQTIIAGHQGPGGPSWNLVAYSTMSRIALENSAIIPTSFIYIYIYIYIVILSYFSFCPSQLGWMGWSSHRSAKGVLSPSIFLECFSLLPCTFIVLSISLSLWAKYWNDSAWFCYIYIYIYWTKLSSD